MKRTVVLSFVLIFLFFSCQEGAKEETFTKSKDSGVTPRSELVVLMHRMEANVKAIGEVIATGETPDSSLYQNHVGLYSVQANDHIKRDQPFMEFGKTFLDTYDQLFDPTITNTAMVYKETVKVCLNCHESYCPGPMKRIKKLTPIIRIN